MNRNEQIPKQESPQEVSRDEALDVYKKLVHQGITTPDELDLNEPSVVHANWLFGKWLEQEDKKAEGDVDAEQRINFEKTMFYVDAGFTDKAYLEEVLGWLAEDGMSVDKLPDDKTKTKLRKDMAEAIKKIRKMLSA
jgi:hypothetical protein